MTAILRERNGKYHVQLAWYQGKERKQKSVATGIPVKGNNKREAEAERKRILSAWEEKVAVNHSDILFSGYLKEWLETAKYSVKENTYHEYKQMIERRICPYFEEKGITLQDLKPYHIQAFYRRKMDIDKVSANTIHRYHSTIHKALRNAYETDRIAENPARKGKITLPQKEQFRGDYYTPDELRKLVDVARDTKLEVPIMLESWFGMRRGEIVGVRWSSINFETKTLYMNGTVTDKGSGSRSENLTYRNYAKTPSSIRTFPLEDDILLYLKALRSKQAANRLLAGREYNQQWGDFVCVDEMGNLIHPEYISRTFPILLRKHGLRKIRFHDLRHTNATLLLEQGASLKEIQVWMGHKSFSTTADTYAHVQANAKKRLAETMRDILANK